LDGFEVSTFGRVRSVKMIAVEDQCGVAVINYRKGGVRKVVRLKRVMVDTFCPEDAHIETRNIGHYDDNAANCRLDNLVMLVDK